MKQMKEYNHYVEEEDRCYQQLKTLESCQSALFDHIYKYGGQFDEMTAEEVLLNIHRLEDSIRLDLLHVRLGKAFQAYHTDKAT
ncbi:hypothetical protein [Paenibacillus pinihumi]|uniref:hypothetical protein n=1 Tax=Paenibacillus pinihumi TaxID=669462 RepID=UPI00041DDFF8|nr:hypothetical protein [Paenibacillus pinihumi]